MSTSMVFCPTFYPLPTPTTTMIRQEATSRVPLFCDYFRISFTFFGMSVKSQFDNGGGGGDILCSPPLRCRQSLSVPSVHTYSALKWIWSTKAAKSADKVAKVESCHFRCNCKWESGDVVAVGNRTATRLTDTDTALSSGMEGRARRT